MAVVRMRGTSVWPTLQAVCLAWLATACGAARGPLPLGPEPIAFVDTLPIAEPSEYRPLESASLVGSAFVGGFARTFSFRRWTGSQRPALNVTRFDDVVDSSWFQHRIGRRPMTPLEVARGPLGAGPAIRNELTVIRGKSEGRSPGLTVRDLHGDEYLLKFDPPGFRHLTSAADVIASRFFHAAGYNTPENYIVVFDSAQLRLHPEAQIRIQGRNTTMEHADLSEILSRVDPLPDGRYLAMASRMLPGVLKGPFRFAGRRRDDPNDYYYHEYRRELRGLHVVAAWLNHVDMRFTNTLDTFVEPGYLRHYLIDFGEALGSATVRPHEPRAGREHDFDLAPTLARMFSLGFFRMPWQDRQFHVIHPEIGWLPVREYEPDAWKPNWPNEALRLLTPRDGYWGAKLVSSFTDEHIRATVAEGRLSAVAADTLSKILSFRRDKTVAYWFSLVTPIENVETRGGRWEEPALLVSFDDLGIRHGVWAPENVSYRWALKHSARGLDRRGLADARSGAARQTILIGGVATAAAAVKEPSGGESTSRLSASRALATLDIVAIRSTGAGQAVRIYLRWVGGEEGYRVVGLEH